MEFMKASGRFEVPADWIMSTGRTLLFFKDKDEPLMCESYKAVKFRTKATKFYAREYWYKGSSENG